MKVRLIALLALVLAMPSFFMAQSVAPNGATRCYTVEAETARHQRNPGLESKEDFENWLAPLVNDLKNNQADASQRVAAVTTIPVIFHIIHDNDAVGSGDNLSASYINAQVEQLNNDYRRVSGSSGFNTHTDGADTEIEFCMATLDENGNTLSEPGINRINRTSKGWTAPPYGTCSGGFNDAYIENTLKPQSQWDPDQYLNIWVFRMNCGILGYAQFPSSSGLGGLNSNGGSASTDGVVMGTQTIGSTTLPNPNGAPYNQGRTATHEVGHWLGLRHIWGDGGCGVDDFCNDTPESDAANYGCPNHSSCGTTDMVENYMDYTDDNCMNIFTSDQKARIQTVMANSPRRSSLASSDRCGSGGGGSGTNCSTTISSFPYSEGFESGTGAWSQVSGDDFDWTRDSGGTPSSSTGPSSAAQGTWYMYVEASSPNYPSKTTIFNGPCFDLSSASQADFSFQYSMYGSNMGSLNLEANTGSGWSSIWNKSGDQGTAWGSANVSLAAYLGNTVQLRYVGATGSSYRGDIAIDDLALNTSGGGGSGGCSTTVSSFPSSTDFESSFGNWSQDTGDDFDWTRNSGSTPSSNTGPSSASQGTFYAYVESSSPNNSNDVAILNGPCYDLNGSGTANFNFDYHLYGASNMGNLVLELSSNSGSSWSSVWSAIGNQGNAWASASVDLSSYTASVFQLRFVGTTGSTWQGDMAIDNMSMNTVAGCNTVNISLTFDDYPEETSWAITNSSGSTVASGGTYGSQADRSTLNLTECLDDGCYTFTISDVYGDGICCTYGNGSYLVTNSSNTTLASGSSFSSSEATAFCVSGGSRVDVPQPETAFSPTFSGLTLFPNPTRSVLNVGFESLNDGEANIKVTDLAGKIIMDKSVTVNLGQNKAVLNVRDLPQGTYLMIMEIDGGRLSRRFVIME